MFRKAAVSIIVVALAGCGAKSSAPAIGATLEGNVQGASALTVAVPGTALSTRTDARGHFALVDVPEGSHEVHFSGEGVDASLQIPALSRREHRSLSVSVSGHDASEHPEQEGQEIHGIIDTIAAPNFTLAGGKVVATTTATIFMKGGAAIAFADLSVGDAVEAEGALQADGSLLARSVSVEAAGNENEADGGDDKSGSSDTEDVHFQGALNAINGASLTVGTTAVQTDASTRIEKNDQVIAASALQQGDPLSVEGLLQADGSLLAKEIKVLSAEEQRAADITGAVTAVDAHSFTIGATVIAVDANTHFSGQGSFSSLANVAVGDMLDVDAAKQADGSFLALKVARLDQPEMNEIEVQGPIQAVDASSLEVQGKTFIVDSATEIRKSGDAVQFSTLKAGQNAEVRGMAAADGSLHATRISL